LLFGELLTHLLNHLSELAFVDLATSILVKIVESLDNIRLKLFIVELDTFCNTGFDSTLVVTLCHFIDGLCSVELSFLSGLYLSYDDDDWSIAIMSEELLLYFDGILITSGGVDQNNLESVEFLSVNEGLVGGLGIHELKISISLV
jgi:hypothetical protein